MTAAAGGDPPATRGRRRSASLLIALCLAAQGVAGFKLLCPPRSLPALAPLRRVCAPALWPFLDYNMYVAAHHEGEELSRLEVYLAGPDGIQREVLPEDLDLKAQAFKQQVVRPLRERDTARVRLLAERIAGATGLRVERLLLRRLVLRVARTGAASRREETLRTFDLSAERP